MCFLSILMARQIFHLNNKISTEYYVNAHVIKCVFYAFVSVGRVIAVVLQKCTITICNKMRIENDNLQIGPKCIEFQLPISRSIKVVNSKYTINHLQMKTIPLRPNTPTSHLIIVFGINQYFCMFFKRLIMTVPCVMRSLEYVRV